MSYISTEEVKNIRAILKEKHPKFKFSVSGGNSMKVSVAIMSGPTDFSDYSNSGSYSSQITEYGKYADPSHKEFFESVFAAIRSQNYYDESDISTDYFNVAYYYSLRIGTYDKPYVQK
jgi:hypothetical protein